MMKLLFLKPRLRAFLSLFSDFPWLIKITSRKLFCSSLDPKQIIGQQPDTRLKKQSHSARDYLKLFARPSSPPKQHMTTLAPCTCDTFIVLHEEWLHLQTVCSNELLKGKCYHCIFHLFVWPNKNSPLPGAGTGALYSSRALKLSGSHNLPWLFFASLEPMLLGGAERVSLILIPLYGPLESGAISLEHPGALCRLANSPSQVAISSVRNTIFSPPTITSFFSGSCVLSTLGEGGSCIEWRSPSASVNASVGNRAGRVS